MKTDLSIKAPAEQKLLTIKATPDFGAYINFYLNFCVSKKFYDKEFRKSGVKSAEPVSFRLINDQSIDITSSVKFIKKNRKK